MGKTDDPNYCLCHRMLGYPTKSCYIFNDVLQALIDAEVLKLRPEQKKVISNIITTTPLQFGQDLPPVPTGVVPIPKGELRVINTDPTTKKEKGLVPILTSQGGVMWVHPNLIEDQQQTIVTNKKSKGKEKTPSYNAVCASSREAGTDVASLTDSQEEEIVLPAKQSASPVAETRSSQQYLKKYDKAVPSSSKSTKEPAKQSTKQLVDKQKELQYAKAI